MVLVSLGATVTIVLALMLWQRFQTNPVMISVDTNYQAWSTPFPALSVCPYFKDDSNGSSLNMISLIKDVLNMTLGNMNEFQKYVGKKFAENINMRQLVQENHVPCTEMFVECKWKNKHFNCCAEFHPLISELNLCYTFNSRVANNLYTDYGPENWKEVAIREMFSTEKAELYIKLNESFARVFYHASDDIPEYITPPLISTPGNRIKILAKSNYIYSVPEVKTLRPNQRKCYFFDEIKSDLMPTRMYNTASCRIRCRILQSLSACQCVPFFYPSFGYKICDVNGTVCLNDHFEDIVNSECNCMLGCTHTAYSLEGCQEELSLPNQAVDQEIIITLATTTQRYKRQVMYGWLDLTVGFGGIAGLFLGLSFVTVFEFIYFFSLREICSRIWRTHPIPILSQTFQSQMTDTVRHKHKMYPAKSYFT